MYTISGKHKGTEINDRRTRSGIDNDKLHNVLQYSCNTDSQFILTGLWSLRDQGRSLLPLLTRFSNVNGGS